MKTRDLRLRPDADLKEACDLRCDRCGHTLSPLEQQLAAFPIDRCLRPGCGGRYGIRN